METTVTLESLLLEMITPIINEVVDKAISKHFVITPSTPPTNNVLTLEEAAEYLKISKPTLYGWVHDRKLSCSKAGKRLYFRMDDLYNYLTQNRNLSMEEIKQKADDYIARKGKKY